MSTLKTEDLFVVYQPETGIPHLVTIVDQLTTDLDKSTGEIYDVSTTPTNNRDVGNQLETYTSLGNGLVLSLKINSGIVSDTHIITSGSGYVKDEILTISIGSDEEIELIVTEVGTNGEVNELDFYLDRSGSGCTITDGLLTGFPFGGHDELMSLSTNEYGTTGNFINFKIVSGVVVYSTDETVFTSDYISSPSSFKVGTEVHVLGTRLVDGPHISVNIAAVKSTQSGGASKYSVDQLITDVQEWASMVNVNLDVSVVDNDGVLDHGGDLSYDIDSGILTYTRAYNPPIPTSYFESDISITQEYGYIVDTDGIFTSDSVTTQEQLNQKTQQRLDFIEGNIYQENSERLGHNQPRLITNTEAKDAAGSTYSDVATKNDLVIINGRSDQAFFLSEKIATALDESTSFQEFKDAIFPPEEDNNY